MCIPKIPGKFPPWKAAAAFVATCEIYTSWRSGACCWIYWAWTKSHCNQWGKKKNTRKKKKDFVSVPCRAGLLFVDPFGPCDMDINSFETMTIWLIQGHWLILGLLKNLLSNMEHIFGHKIAMKCLQIYVSETKYSLRRLGVRGRRLSLSHLCLQCVEPGAQITDQ